MGDLTIDDIDDELMDEVRRRAASHGRSTEAEVEAILREAVSRMARLDEPMSDRATIIEELRRFRESLPPITAPPFTQDLGRGDRNR